MKFVGSMMFGGIEGRVVFGFLRFSCYELLLAQRCLVEKRERWFLGF